MRQLFTLSHLLLAAVLFTLLVQPSAEADTCLSARVKRKKVRFKTVERSGSCRKTEITLPAGAAGDPGPQGETGATGPQGATGVDGQLRIYGDGSAGAKTVTSNETLSDTNLQYTDFTINAGVTLAVPSGTVIRCTGEFTNNGTITVSPVFASGGWRSGDPNLNLTSISNVQAAAGVSVRAPGNGQLGDDAATIFGGTRGRSLLEYQSRQLRYPGPVAGAGGGSGGILSGDPGGDGGGSIVILCEGMIRNTFVIEADGGNGDDGGGGGAGGVVILASRTAIENTNTGVISVGGGRGSDSDSSRGVGGGGGGGIVHFLAPSVTDNGTIGVNGGSAGTAGIAGSVTATLRSGGGGGGGCGGDGGSGGSVSTADTPSAANNGSAGYSLVSEVDPTALF